MTNYKSEPIKHLNFFNELDSRLENAIDNSVLDFSCLSKIIETEYPKEQWLVEKLIPKDGITCIGGLPATMKSYFSNYLALCIVQGKSVLDRYSVSDANILFIDKENKLSRIKDRFLRLDISLDASNKIFYLGTNFLVDDAKDLAATCAFIKDHNIKLTIIDTLIRIHNRNENEASEINRVFLAFKEMMLAGSGICFIHHFNKRGSFGVDIDVRDQLRGSSDILAMVDSFISLSRKENFIEVEQAKSRDEVLIPKFLMQVSFEKNKTFFNYIREVEHDERIENILVGDRIFSLLTRNTASRKFIVSQFPDISIPTIDRAIKQLKLERRIVSYTNGSREYVYSINKQTELP